MSAAARHRHGGGPVKLILALIVIGAVIGGAWVVLTKGGDQTEEADAEEALFAVKEGPLLISVTESGTIRPSEQVIIKNELEGRSTILYLIPEGTRVRKDELLVELDASGLEDAKVDQEIRVQNAESSFIESRENLAVVENKALSLVEAAELKLRFAKEDLNQYREGEFPNLLTEKESNITLAEEELQQAEDKVEWSRVLFKEKYIAESELERDELTVKQRELKLKLARNALQLLKEYTYKRRIAELESDVRQNELALERTRREASADVLQAEAQLRARESEFKRQQDKLEKIKEQIGMARILAPTEGLVVYATSARASWRGNNEPLDEGQEVRERQELIHLPTASTFKAEVKIHESALEKIRLDLPVRLEVDALPGQQFTGKVTKIAPLPDAQSMFMNPDLKVYGTEITIDDGRDMLRTGMTCEAEIIVETHRQALYVPIQSVTRVGGKPTAYVTAGDEAVPREVEIGLDNNRMVHILGGLEAGEEVLLAPPLHLSVAEETDLSDVPDVPPAPKDGPARGGGPPASGQGGGRPGGGAVGTPGPGAPPGDAAGGAPEGRGSMSPEQRAKMRERYEKMTPEEREKARQRFMKMRGGQGGGRPRGGARPGPGGAGGGG